MNVVELHQPSNKFRDLNILNVDPTGLSYGEIYRVILEGYNAVTRTVESQHRRIRSLTRMRVHGEGV